MAVLLDCHAFKSTGAIISNSLNCRRRKKNDGLNAPTPNQTGGGRRKRRQQVLVILINPRDLCRRPLSLSILSTPFFSLSFLFILSLSLSSTLPNSHLSLSLGASSRSIKRNARDERERERGNQQTSRALAGGLLSRLVGRTRNGTWLLSLS